MRNLFNELENFINNIVHSTEKYKLKCGSYAIQGYRDHMEDRKRMVKIKLNNIQTCYLVLLCDGHSGEKCATHIINVLPKILQKTLKNISSSESSKNINKLLTTVILNIDKDYKQYNDLSGTTCVFGLFINNQLYIINIGDSRCIIGSMDEKVKLATNDHKPGISKEYKRIYANGGSVTNIDTHRVYIDETANGLAISRVIGDVHYKGRNIVIANPDIYIRSILNKNEFMILASDGLWDVVTNEEVILFVKQRINKMYLTDISKQLVNYALMKGSGDNITVIVCVVR